MTLRTIWQLFKIGRRVKKWVETSYTKELERVLVEVRRDLDNINPHGYQIDKVIDKLDETVESLKINKLDPFEMEQGE